MVNVSQCYALSGPGCTWAPEYNVGQCSTLWGFSQHSANTLECALSAATQLEQALQAQRQYILTLWPAFVVLVCSFGPDPSDMVYDNIWWSVLFAITCGGSAGFDGNKPRHHYDVDSIDEGVRICATQPSKRAANIPELVPRLFRRPQPIVWLEWVLFALSLALYISFTVLFVFTIRRAFSFAENSFIGMTGIGIWFWISASPAIGQVLAEAIQNRVELYEPSDRYQEEQDKSENNALLERPHANTSVDADDRSHLYVRTHGNFSKTWARIILLQWSHKPYRVLVKPSSRHWLLLLWQLMIGLGRLVIFVYGSVTMGGVLFFPMPHDMVLLVLLLFACAVPRLVFYGIWRNKARGADIVLRCDDDLPFEEIDEPKHEAG